MKKTFLLLVFLLPFAFLYGQNKNGYNDLIDLSIDRLEGQYAKGEKVCVNAAFDASLKEKVCVEVVENGEVVSTRECKAASGIILKKRYSKPTLVFVNVYPVSEPTNRTSIGFIVDPEHFEPGFDCPEDLNDFWQGQIQALRAIPMESRTFQVPLSTRDSSRFDVFDVRINSIDDTPCIGYVAKPKNAAPGSLPIVLFTHGAGVNKKGSRSNISTAVSCAKWGNGAIAFDLNALGMENNREQAYYDSLANGKYYKYSSRPIVNHEDCLFRTMFLRLVRALDYLTQDPAWDGKRILVYGSSQGGAQSAALAGMDPRVGAAVIVVPAMMDMGGRLSGHNATWCLSASKELTPEMIKTAPYYDTANLIRNFKGKLFAECGLIDVTCPASCVFSGYNKANCEKEIHSYPYRPHNEPMGRYRQAWLDNIKSRRDAFINDYLK